MTRVFGTPTDQDVYTYSLWVKKAANDAGQVLLGYGTTSALNFAPNNTLQLNTPSGAVATTAVFRDSTNWQHLVYSQNGTAVSLEVNGKVVATGALASTQFNTATTHYIGRFSGGTYPLTAYLARVCFVDGQALSSSDFGYFNTAVNEWVTKSQTEVKQVVDAGGVNSFMLDFENGTSLTTLGEDFSIKGNDWTLTGHSLTLGADYDWMLDVPGNSYATLNSLYTGKSTLTKANLTASGTTDLPTIQPASGNWYFEISGVATNWTPPAAFPAAAGDYNFGQRPFTNTPTVGYSTLCQQNLSVPELLNPEEGFKVVLSTGAGIKASAEAIFGGDFLEWIKDRANSNDNQLLDTLRGLTAVVSSNNSNAETVYSAPSGSSVAWINKAGAAAAANNAGTIAASVSANLDTGFSIVTYTGTGIAGTVGHGLDTAPELIIARNRGGTTGWRVYHKKQAASPELGYLVLTAATAYTVSSTEWNNTAPTSSVFSVGIATQVNTLAAAQFAYCFKSVEGFSKIDSVVMNSSADGMYVACGFKPAYVLLKRIDSTSSWLIKDSTRSPENVANETLVANTTAAEVTSGTDIDFLSQGFKVRTSLAGTYVFLAFAEVAGKYSLAR